MTKVVKPGEWNAHYDLVYDAWNRLVEVKDGTTTIAQYEYDGLNRRIVKTVDSDTFHYYYNTNWQLLEVRKDGVTDPVEQYVWHPHYIDALAVRYHDANTDGDYADTNEVQYYTHDVNYNVTALLDASGNVIERYNYTPYGKLAVLDSDFNEDSDGKSDVANPYTFTGRRLDEETGFYYYRYRYYHEQLGRFLSRDPIGYDEGSVNLYAFANSSPLRFVDPLGLRIGDCCAPPHPRYANASAIRVTRTLHGPRNNYNPDLIEDAFANLDQLKVLDDLVFLVEFGAAGLTEGAVAALTEFLTDQIEDRVAPNWDLVDLGNEMLRTLSRRIESNLAFSLWVEVEWLSCDEAPWYSSCCYRLECHTAKYRCRKSWTASVAQLPDTWGGPAPAPTLDDLRKCYADAKGAVRSGALKDD